MAHSAYPELGESAIHKLLDALADIRRIPLPVDDLLGPSTLNIGTLAGGRAPNVIADEARADIMIRLVGDSADTKAALCTRRRRPRRTARSHRNSRRPPRPPSTASRPPWSPSPPTFRPSAAPGASRFLIGPGTIHVAHTLEERVPKAQLLEAVEIYQRIVKDLCKRESK